MDDADDDDRLLRECRMRREGVWRSCELSVKGRWDVMARWKGSKSCTR